MKISISVSVNRVDHLDRFCNALAHNSVDLEVIFVGPVKKFIEMPFAVPTRFIDVPGQVGAAQCWAIGAHEAKGDLLGFASDDVVYSQGFLDDVEKQASLLHQPNDMFTARYFFNNRDQFGEGMRIRGYPYMPTLPVCGFSFTEDHIKLGGIDRRFRAVLWDSDLYMHMYSLGGHVTVLDNHSCDEVNGVNGLFERNAGYDWPVLEKFWPPPISADMKRALPRETWTEQELRSCYG